MRYPHAEARPLEEPEVVLNLWAYVNEGGYILRLAGKSYVMDGDDEEKLALLRELSKTDFLSASWCKVPSGFTLKNPEGEEMSGVAHASLLSNPISHGHLFGPLMEELAGSLPDQLRSYNGEYAIFRLDLPREPLNVTTIVMEYEDGRLVPMVSGQQN